jgi:uncharacterized protein (TIGR03000 family)
MSKRFVRGAVVMALAVAAVLLLPQVSEAQRRYRGYRGNAVNRGWGYGTYGYGGYGGYRGYGIGNPGYGGYGLGGGYMGAYSPGNGGMYFSNTPGMQSYQSFYPPQLGMQGSPNEVRLVVRVPDPNAQVIIDGNPTRQTGLEREFVSEMQPGSSGTYQVKVRWTENGRTREQTRNVPVRPGQQQVVNITQAQGGSNPDTTDDRVPPPVKD